MIGVSDLSELWQLWVLFAGLTIAGVWVSWRAFRAARDRPSRPLSFLAGGLALLTVGVPSVWTATYVVSEQMFLCTIASSGAALLGAVFVLTSVEMRTD